MNRGQQKFKQITRKNNKKGLNKKIQADKIPRDRGLNAGQEKNIQILCQVQIKIVKMYIRPVRAAWKQAVNERRARVPSRALQP